MKSGEYTPGRDLKIVHGGKKNAAKVWQARLGRSHRVRFTTKEGKARIVRIGPHHYFD